MVDRALRYSAGLMSEAPWFLEFRKLLTLQREGIDVEEIRKKCVDENLFGMKKEYSALRAYGYLLNRVSMVDSQLRDLFFSSDLDTQKLINLIAIMKGDRLFSEMINEVYREKTRLGYTELTASDINVFFTEKCNQDEDMKNWKDTTFRRLRSGYFQFLTDANLLRKEKSKYYITPPILDIALERYLEFNGGESILKAITGVN